MCTQKDYCPVRTSLQTMICGCPEVVQVCRLEASRGRSIPSAMFPSKGIHSRITKSLESALSGFKISRSHSGAHPSFFPVRTERMTIANAACLTDQSLKPGLVRHSRPGVLGPLRADSRQNSRFSWRRRDLHLILTLSVLVEWLNAKSRRCCAGTLRAASMKATSELTLVYAMPKPS